MSPPDDIDGWEADDHGRATPAEDDDALLADLRWALGRDDDVPLLLADLARDALHRTDPSDELALLVATTEPAGVRDDGPTDVVTFAASPGWRLEVRLDRTGPSSVASGVVSPARAVRVGWESAAGRTGWTEADGGGFFELAGVPSGPVRFVVATGPGAGTRTDWVTV